MFNVNYPQQKIITKKAKIQQKSTTDEKSIKAGATKQNVQDVEGVQTGTIELLSCLALMGRNCCRGSAGSE